MAAEQKIRRPKKPPTPTQAEINKLRAIDKDRRTEEQKARLADLVGKERRARFLRLESKRVRNARKALRNVARMGSTAQYDYTSDEAQAIVNVLTADMAEVKRAFQGAPTEKGKYDL